MFEIVEKRQVAPNIHEIVVKAPRIAAAARAGQFAILMAAEKSERVPFTLADWDAGAGTVTLVVLETGKSSGQLVRMGVGDEIAHLAGPLGEPVAIGNVGTVALAAGCYGIGAILCIAKALKAAGNEVIAIVEARSHYLHYYKDRLAAASDEIVQTTIDGSEGRKGHAVDALGEMLAAGRKIDRVVAVGCPFMMMLVASETRPLAVPTEAALNPIMVDGTGMCGACRVSIGGETKFACVDGPFFNAHQVDWDELFTRRSAYHAQEVGSVQQTEPQTFR